MAARQIVEQTEVIAVRLRTRANGESGKLTIGIHSAFTAGNLRATLIEHRRRFPDVDTQIVDGSSEHLVSDLLSSAVDVAFIAESIPQWGSKVLPVWSERVVVAVPSNHIFADREVILWPDLLEQRLLLPQRGPGPEFVKLLITKAGWTNSNRVLRHDAGLDRILALVGVGFGLSLALEGATGASYPGVIYRGVNGPEGPTRVNFGAYWCDGNCNPALQPFLDLLHERYPDLPL